MDGLEAAFDETVSASAVKPRARDRWRVTPPAIRITDTRPEGGPFQLLVTTRGETWTGCQFDKLRAFALDADEAVTEVSVIDDQRDWLRPNQTVLIAAGTTVAATSNLVIMLVAEVHAPSGEPPVDFALELLPIQTPEPSGD